MLRRILRQQVRLQLALPRLVCLLREILGLLCLMALLLRHGQDSRHMTLPRLDSMSPGRLVLR